MKLYYSIVESRIDSEGFKLMLNEAIEKKASDVIILAELEWEIRNLQEYAKDFADNNVGLTVLLCSGYSNFYDQFTYNIEYWPTFWINWSYENLKWTNEFKNYNLDINNFKYPFICLNNRSHLHRCALIDELAKENLIDKGVVTWVKHLNENPGYPYKHFDNRQILLDDDFVTKLDSFLIPKEYNQSFFHIVSEATHITDFISEKTVIPIYMKKPFVVLSAPGFHKRLESFGFKLYDEFIDYSFDEVEDLHKRTELFVKNIHSLVNLNLTEAYKLLLPKLEYNYNRAMEIKKDKSLIPDIIKERVQSISKPELLVDIRYITFLND
jgi:hypothetical protein